MQTTIPFDGFYESIPDSIIDDAINLMISDSSGDPYNVDIWGEINCSEARQVVATMYVENFQKMLKDEGLSVSFSAVVVDSPREYNFTTDRIFVEISTEDALAMFAAVDKTILDRVCREHLTTRSGFISYYHPDYMSWGTVTEWDANQLGMITHALADQFGGTEWRWTLCEDMDSNGDVSNAVYSGLTDEGRRLVEITDYLRRREERQYA